MSLHRGWAQDKTQIRWVRPNMHYTIKNRQIGSPRLRFSTNQIRSFKPRNLIDQIGTVSAGQLHNVFKRKEFIHCKTHFFKGITFFQPI